MNRTAHATDMAMQQSDALKSAACWRLLGLLLERPREGWSEEVVALAREVEDPLLREAAAAAAGAGAGRYLELLGPGAPLSPREVAYRGRHDPGQILADIAAYHQAFAFRPQAEDPIDHLAIEAGFVGYLQLKAAYALARGDAEAASVTSAAIDRFIAEHVRWIAAPLAAKLAAAGLEHVALAAAAIARRVGEPPAPPQQIDGALASGLDSDGEGLSCGGCAGLDEATGGGALHGGH